MLNVSTLESSVFVTFSLQLQLFLMWNY